MRLVLALGFPVVCGAASGPLGYWPFEEGAGTTTADQSGNGLTGTLENGPAWTHSPIGTNGLMFDGSNDRITLGNPVVLQMTGPMTLSAWVNVRSFTTRGRIVTRGGGGIARGWSLNVEAGNGTTTPFRAAAFQIASSSSALVSVPTTGAIASNQWIHLGGVYEPGVALRIYTNGFLNNQITTGVPATQYNNNLAVTIGDRPPTVGGTPFNGLIDSVRIYNRALSAAELRALPELAQSPITFLIEPVSQTVRAPLLAAHTREVVPTFKQPSAFQATLCRTVSGGVAIALPPYSVARLDPGS